MDKNTSFNMSQNGGDKKVMTPRQKELLHHYLKIIKL